MNDEVARKLEAAERLMKTVEHALTSASIGIDELTVAAAPSGDVTVFGVTTSIEAAKRAQEIVQAVPGVRRVLASIIVRR